MIDDQLQVAGLLQNDKETGAFTQGVEQDIVRRLAELIGALQQEREQKKKGGGQGMPGGGMSQKPRLVPPTAEIKMLRTMQRSLLQQTETVARGMGRPEGPTPAEALTLRRLRDQQGSLAERTKDFVDRVEKMIKSDEEGEPGKDKKEPKGEKPK